MSMQSFLVWTMSDTVETDIHRIHDVSNGILQRYGKETLSFDQLRKIADGPFDLFLIPLIFKEDWLRDQTCVFDERLRQEIRGHALEVARRYGYDTTAPDLIPGVDRWLCAARELGLRNILMTTAGKRYRHQSTESQGVGGHFEETIDRDETYYTKEQGIYHLFRKTDSPLVRVVLLTGTASFVRAGNRLEKAVVGGNRLEVTTVALSWEHAYNDEETLAGTAPKFLIRGMEELLPILTRRVGRG